MSLVEDPLGILLARWRQQDIELLPGEPPHAVVAAFARIGVRPTPDVIELYGRIGGMREMDAEYWRLWPLKEVAEQSATVGEFGPIFSDYLVSCWDYRLRPNVSGMSAVYVDYYDPKRPPNRIAPSLDAFFSAYVADAGILLDAG